MPMIILVLGELRKDESVTRLRNVEKRKAAMPEKLSQYREKLKLCHAPITWRGRQPLVQLERKRSGERSEFHSIPEIPFYN